MTALTLRRVQVPILEPLLQLAGPADLHRRQTSADIGQTGAEQYRAIPLISDPFAYPTKGASRLKKEMCADSSHFLSGGITCRRAPSGPRPA